MAPEKIEDTYTHSPFISQVFVYGDSFESYLVAIVVLDNDYVKKWASQNGNSIDTAPSRECSIKLKQIVLGDMIREGKKQDLMSYEQVKTIEFINEPFTVEEGLLTPTLKLRRYAIEKKYKNLFQKLYKNAKD